MSQRNMYNCTDCDSIAIVTVVEAKEDRVPLYCVICGSDKILKIEASNE